MYTFNSQRDPSILFIVLSVQEVTPRVPPNMYHQARTGQRSPIWIFHSFHHTTTTTTPPVSQVSRAAVWSQSVLVVRGGGGGGGAVACEDSPSHNGRHFLHKRVGHVLRDKVGDMGGT